MSKIKDLLAEEQGIDDLMPVKDVVDMVGKLEPYYEAIKKVLSAEFDDIKDQMRHDAEFEYETDEDGNGKFVFFNYYGECMGTAEDYLYKYIEDQHLDLSEPEFEMLHEWLGNWLADELVDLLDEVEKEANE